MVTNQGVVLRGWKLGFATFLLCVGAAAVLYATNMMLYSLWVSSQPQYDGVLWGRRATGWLLAVVVLIVIEIGGIYRVVVLVRKWRRASMSVRRCSECGYNLAGASGRCPECGKVTYEVGK